MSAILRGVRAVTRIAREQSSQPSSAAIAAVRAQQPEVDTQEEVDLHGGGTHIQRTLSPDVMRTLVLSNLSTLSGDRASGQTPADPRTLDRVVDGVTYFATPVTTMTDSKLTQDQLSFTREAVTTYAQERLTFDPSQTEQTLKDSIDSTFGTLTSDVIGVRLENTGAGSSTLHFKQFDGNTTNSETEHSVLATAYTYAAEIYAPAKPVKKGLGDDPNIQQAAKNLSQSLGYQAQPLVDDLQRALKSGQGVDAAVNEISKYLDDVGGDGSQQQSVQNFRDTVSAVEQNVENDSNQNPVFGEVSKKYQSGKYALAWSSTQIAESAALTANTDFLAYWKNSPND